MPLMVDGIGLGEMQKNDAFQLSSEREEEIKNMDISV